MLGKKLCLIGMALLACAVSLVALMPQAANWVKQDVGAASIIQAAFSIVAVMVALVLPEIQAETQERATHRRQMRLLAELVQMADALLRSAADASHNQELAIQFRGHYHMARWEAARDALADFPIIVFNSASEARDLMNLRALMRESVDLLSVGERGFSHGPNPHLAFEASLARIRMLREQAEASIENLLKPPK